MSVCCGLPCLLLVLCLVCLLVLGKRSHGEVVCALTIALVLVLIFCKWRSPGSSVVPSSWMLDFDYFRSVCSAWLCGLQLW